MGSTTKIGTTKIGTTKIGTTKIGTTKIGTTKIGTTKMVTNGDLLGPNMGRFFTTGPVFTLKLKGNCSCIALLGFRVALRMQPLKRERATAGRGGVYFGGLAMRTNVQGVVWCGARVKMIFFRTAGGALK